MYTAIGSLRRDWAVPIPLHRLGEALRAPTSVPATALRETRGAVQHSAVLFVLYGGLASLTGCTSVLFVGPFEALYYTVRRRMYHECNRDPVQLPTDAEVEQAFQRFVTLRDSLDMKEFLAGWFQDAAFDQLTEGDVRNFVALGFYARRYRTLCPEHRAQVRSMVEEVQLRWGISLQGGGGELERSTLLSHLEADLYVIEKPVLLHLTVEAINCVARTSLLAMGFRRVPAQAAAGQLPICSYWQRSPSAYDCASVEEQSGTASPDAGAHADPIVFVHGVGAGIAPYLPFIQQLLRHAGRHRRIIVLEVPQVSMRLHCTPAAVNDMADEALATLSALDVRHAEFVGHSFGTLILSRMRKQAPHRVSSLCLLDPVCMMLCLPKLTSSFLYKRRSRGLLSQTPAKRLIASDLLVAHTLSRNFVWHQLMLWADEIPRNSVVVLSGRDELVPSAAIREHVESAASEGRMALAPALFHYPDMRHGGFLLDTRAQDEILAAFLGRRADAKDDDGSGLASTPSEQRQLQPAAPL